MAAPVIGRQVRRDKKLKAPMIQDILAQLDGAFPFDEAVLEALPRNVTYTSVESFGNSPWAVTGRVTARKADGTFKQFFLKVAYGEHGRGMLLGEFVSSNLIHDVIPGLIPRPYGYGSFKAQGSDAHFYLSQFIDMDLATAPDPKALMGRLAELHKKSRSPHGKFGFHVITYDGTIPHRVSWKSTWVDFFRNLFMNAYILDAQVNEPWPELDLAVRRMSEVVIPRLLGNLRQNGTNKPVKPCLIHGALWEGNRGIDMKTRDSVIYDASSYFAHNEMEFGHWQSELNTFFRSKTYIAHYFKHFPPAEPVGEFDDRNRLYSIKVALDYSAMRPGSMRRRTAYNDMCYLINKYGPIAGLASMMLVWIRQSVLHISRFTQARADRRSTC